MQLPRLFQEMIVVVLLLACAACGQNSAPSANMMIGTAEPSTTSVVIEPTVSVQPTAHATPTLRPLPTIPAKQAPAATPQDVILIYPLGTDPPDGSNYQQTAETAARRDLATRLGAAEGDIALQEAVEQEVSRTQPCGGIASQPGAAGVALGYDMTFQIQVDYYRYVAIGGLAHYCGQVLVE